MKLNIDQLSSFSPPFWGQGPSPAPLNKMNCKECKQPLGKVTFTRGYHFICLNWRCPLYRVPQISEIKRVALRYNKPPGKYGSWESYRLFLQRRSENYHKLSDMGFPYDFCNRFKSDKQTHRIMRMVKRGLSVPYIREMLSGER